MIASYEQVTLQNKAKLTGVCRCEIIFRKKYKSHKKESLQILSDSKDMWYQHLYREMTIKHKIELRSSNTRRVYCAPGFVGLVVR